MTSQPINLTDLRHNVRLTQDARYGPFEIPCKDLLHLIDVVEAAKRCVASYGGDPYCETNELGDLEEILVRYTVPKPDAPPANPSNRSA